MVSWQPPANHYRFITRWRLRATAEEVYAILGQPLEYPRWWPSVYLTVRELPKGEASGRRREVRLHTKGWCANTGRTSNQGSRENA